ncbi:hypothetical protein E4J66_11180 [Actinomyces viscosus]|uniref:DUF5979 domain-containing protein n=1 Tax=Actinomyces viscosus TaxID=1656 RepID=A0A448PNJ4_ACTVI|nr:DUF5979 domain-containing protein [Actinomyces viscosus]TFH51658.1 hypothetical protein E4J66_11180 [Actinomyces viscosus]VEI17832.1 Uncharacterised protein [Actinomyces viscosus]
MPLSSLRPRSVGQVAAAALIASVLVLPHPAARADDANDGDVGAFAVVKWVMDYDLMPVAYHPGASSGALLVTGGFPVTNVAANSGIDPDDLDELRKKEFTFTYQCDDAAKTTGTITAKGDGNPVKSPALPVGTMCEITEDLGSAQAEGYVLEDWDSSETVRITGEGVDNVYFTNYYSPTPDKPAPSPSPTSDRPTASPSPTPDTVTPSASASVTQGSSVEPSPSGTAEVTSPNGTTPSTPPAPPAPVLASTGLSLAVALTGLLGFAGGAALLIARRRA